MVDVLEEADSPLRKEGGGNLLTRSVAPSPAFESGVEKCRLGSTLSLNRNEVNGDDNQRDLQWNAEEDGC
jgi:hypothetical protein